MKINVRSFGQDKNFIFLLICFLILSIKLFPQNVQLDTTFGEGGIAMGAVNVFGSALASSGAVQSDGKIIAAGYVQIRINGESFFALVRYNQDGSLDNTFGTNGIVITGVAGSANNDLANSVIIQSDGKIIAAGAINSEFGLARYNSDGSLDSTFGINGIVTTGIGDFAIINSLAIQNDGKIIAVGSTIKTSNYYFTIARYNSNGFLDKTFGENGIMVTDLGTSSDRAKSVLIQNDGKIIAVGWTSNGSNNNVALVRYNSNGFLDYTFGENGIVISDVGGFRASSAVIQNDGKIIVAGGPGFVLARYKQDGTIDSSFGSNHDGIETLNVVGGGAASVSIQGDGKIIVAGSEGLIGNNLDFAVARCNSNGSIDSTFGSNGIVKTQIGAGYVEGAFAVMLSDGKIIAAGYSVLPDYITNKFALACYNTDGSLNKSFGSAGIVTTRVGQADNSLVSIAIQGDGKIVAAGTFSNTSQTSGGLSPTTWSNFGVLRCTANGSLDNTFGSGGIITTDVSKDSSSNYARAVVIQSNGKIVVSGFTLTRNADVFAMVRYNSNGSLDNTFGIDGIDTISIGNEGDAYSIAIQPDGNIIAAGYNNIGSTAGFAIYRFNSYGNLDRTFGTNGISSVKVGDFSIAYSTAIQSDGKIIAAGISYSGLFAEFGLARFNPDGSVDSTFGQNGIDTTRIGNWAQANSVKIQSDGKIVVAGSYSYLHSAASSQIMVVRYNPNGSLDKTFGSGGVDSIDIGIESIANSVAIQSDGKIVLAGWRYKGFKKDIVLVRFNSDGSLDNNFGVNGILTTKVGGSNSSASSVVLQNDGKIVAAGEAYNDLNNYHAFTIIRYLNNNTTDINEESTSKISESYKLEQNYPNPFNPTTVIGYQLPMSGHVVLKVYDILGREIATLVNHIQSAGNHKVTFNASNLASGVYIYTIKAGPFYQAKKLVLLK